ncbi:MAG: glycosyltransferase family 1 protein [Candidatus Heimdallarchaeota archaeon]|nr:glycosyltransferase family 1 protein [Candidatus Heimdallarchaeota archaeon]
MPYALKQASTEYHEISTGGTDLNNRIKAAINSHDFDLAFFQIQADGIVSPDVFRHAKNEGIFTLNWSGDIRRDTERWYFETGADLTCFTNMRDVDNMRSRGLKSDFLQIGIDPVVFKKHGESRNTREIVFMGNNYGNQFPLGQERKNLIAFMQNRFRNQFGAYGSYQGSVGNLNGNQYEESKYYNAAKIGINLSHFNERNYTSDRLFRMLASGVMVISHDYRGIHDDFEIGKHLETYSSFPDLEKKIRYYLGNEPERARIAQNGFDLCHSKFTYKEMVQEIIRLYNQYK